MLVSDAGADAEPQCFLQCSLDGRAVTQSCTGEIVETCPPDQACGGARCQAPCAAAAEDRSSNGCDFYVQKPRFRKYWELPNSCYAAFVVNSSLQEVNIVIEKKGKPLDISKAVFRAEPGSDTLVEHHGPIPAGESVILFLSDRDPTLQYEAQETFTYIKCPYGVVPASFADDELSQTGWGSSFHLTTNVPVGLTTIYPYGGAQSYHPAATLALPVSAWGKEHMIVNAAGSGVFGGPAAQIVASENGTEVTIIPTRNIQDGAGVKGGLKGVPKTYQLEQGQFLQLVQAQELTGSLVTSTKPTTTIGGHTGTNIPVAAAGAADVLAQQIPALQQWGSEYVGVGYRPRTGNEHEPVPYRIVAARDGTRLDYDPEIPPGAPVELSAGQVANFSSGTGDAFVVRTQDADHPIYLAAYMTSATGVASNPDYGGRGDPEFVNVVPTGQYMNKYSFFADPTYGETSLVIVRAKTHGEFKNVWLDCAGDLTSFKPIGTRGEYEFARVDLARGRRDGDKFGDSVCRNGLQRMRSEGPFTATVWGWDSFASYAYPGGTALRKLVLNPIAPVE